MDLDLKSLAAKLNPSCFDALDLAASACVSRSGYEVTVEDFLQPLCDGSDHDLPIIFQYYGLSMAEFRKCLHHEIEQFRSGNTDRPVLSARLVRLIRDAWLLASVDFGLTEIRSGIILLTLARSQKDLSLRAYGDLISRMPVGELYERLFDIVGKSSESARHVAANAGQDPNSALGKYATDFTAKVQAGEIDPVFCRDREIRQMVDILSRRRKNNPIIVGDAGVGKTAVIEGLALRVVDEDVPDVLRGVRILGLDLGSNSIGWSLVGA
ncbi:MAG: type VI secretion system ATPase TssH, partial [Gammaproteobacteria bacterium]